MKLDRALLKSQAKQIIKGNVFKLFLIILIVTLLTGATISLTSSISNLKDVFNNVPSYSNDYDFYNYGDTIGSFYSKSFAGIGLSISSLMTLVFAPLEIALCGLFLHLIHGNNMDLGNGLSYVFKTAFDKNYVNRFLLQLLKSIFIILLSLLFIIPGIIFAYKYYFTSYIMSEKPDMTWKEAIELSKKMTNGHKWELFVLDLSFIPWYLLMSITFGLVGIYVAPYIEATKAIYYENFKQRGLQTGELTPADFMSETEKAVNAGYYQNQNPNFYPPQQPQNPPYPPQYQAPQQPPYGAPYQQPQNPPYQPPQYGEPYQAPYQPPQYEQPQQSEQPPYTPPYNGEQNNQ